MGGQGVTMRKLDRGNAQGRRSVCRMDCPATCMMCDPPGCPTELQGRHKEGLSPSVHLPLVLEMLGADLDSDWELEELN